ncbi:MAG: outer membrane beta-barrel protein [Candidatus Omnitrophica bacterium]|nr:outer membrane beta-barrel protein [Candidatus Omnitrophota bacterium]
MKMYQIFSFLSFLSITLLLNPIVFAAEGLKFADIEVIPWGEIKVQYDDNVFLDSADEKDDIIVTLSPGISLERPFKDNLLKFDYHAEINKFTDHSSQDATNHYVSGELEVNWQELTFNIYDDFSRVFERPSTEDTSRVKRDDNIAGITVMLQKHRLGIQLGYENLIRNYRSEPDYDAYDRKDSTYSLMVTHQTFPKTKLLCEYDFSQIRYEESTRSDSDYHQFLVGAMGELTPKINATIKAGYQFRDYERESEPDFDAGVLYADSIYTISSKDALKISFLRSANESTYGVNNFYKIENVSAVFDHFFSKKLLGFITGIYQINSYPRETTEGTETQKRKDRYASLGAGFRYYMKEWLTLTLQVEHIGRDSNFESFDYSQNLVTLSAKAVF